MRKIKVLIVEDEVIVAKDIAYYLEELGCEIIGILMEGEAVMSFLKQQQPDIILMDIMLKGTLNGVETVHLINKQYDIPIIYLTANTDDRSFDLAKATKPFAFVEKPFKAKNLKRSVALLIEQIVETQEGNKENSNSQFILSDRIFVREKGKMVKIFLSDILYIEADGSYSKIVSKDRVFLLASNLRSLEEKMPKEMFMRVHRSYIINLQKIDSMEDNYIEILQKHIPVSRTHWNDFLKRVNVI